MNNILDQAETLCSGCSVCVYSCPRNCISIKQQNAFYSAHIDEAKCIKCGLCKKRCYRFIDKSLPANSTIYCLKSKNGELIKKSSSGGMSFTLMKKLIENGYVVFGFGYEISSKECKMFKAETLDELGVFLGSKYFQANVYNEKLFKTIISECSNTKMAFFGTPCIIAGIKTLLSGFKLDEVIFVDLFCHGVPSDLLWKKYNNYIEKRTGTIKRVEFRSKKYGWHTFSNVLFGDKGCYSSVNDKYYELYFSGLFTNPSCFDCKVKNDFSNSDIRLGDAWGPTHDRNKTGVSVVACNTKKGKELVDQCFDEIIYEKTISEKEIGRFQSIYSSKSFTDKNRQFINYLLSESEFETIYKEYVKNLCLKARIKRFFKKISNNLPFGLKQYFKYLHHKRK